MNPLNIAALDLDPNHCETCRTLAARIGALANEPTSQQGWPPEPEININGHVLTEAQAMSLRVAASYFAMQMENAEIQAEMGPVAKNYLFHIRDIIRAMHDRQHRPSTN